MANEPSSNVIQTNFIRNIIDEDQKTGKWQQRVETRFPPEPNGYLHIGHAKSICLNFGIAKDYQGVCHLRFDDTNPEKESMEFVESIKQSVKWLGFAWQTQEISHEYYASDYYQKLYECAEILIKQGKAFVDGQTTEALRLQRGTLTEVGQPSPDRGRSIEENLDLFRRMKAGEFQEGQYTLRAKIDMASPNLNLRDPVIYRIRFANHYRTGNQWCIYPMYDYAHCVSDALENITHSLCTLEFKDHRPLYNWFLERLAQTGIFSHPLPQQIEFSRLNLTYVVTSKRKLLQLVQEKHVENWDDPRMPTLVGLRRRGFTPASIRLFCERIGISKADSWIDMSVLEGALREDLEAKAPRIAAVLNPLKLIIDNYPEDQTETCQAPVHPHFPERGQRQFMLSRELWIEQEDFQEMPEKGFFRLYPGNKVRLRYGYVIECTHIEKHEDGSIAAIHCQYFPDSKSGTPGANLYKVKGNIHWVSTTHALPIEVRIYDRLFKVAHPDTGEQDFLQAINPDSKKTVLAYLENSIREVAPETHFQFERHGYFVSDMHDSQPDHFVFNRIVSLKDNWIKQK